MKEIEENQKRVVAGWIHGMEQMTPEGCIRHRHKDCIHIQRPRSMGIPVRNNEQYLKYFTKLLIPTLKNFKVNYEILVNDAKKNTVVITATATGESEIGPYNNEYICVFHFTKDGNELTQIEEIVDSKTTADFFSRLYLASHPHAKL